MEQLLNEMDEEMQGTFKAELEIFYRMSGVFIQMLMFDAEKQNSTVRGDVNFMENYKALQEMKDFEELVMNADFTLEKKQAALMRKSTLPGLGAPIQVEKVVVKDEAVVQENERLQAELQRMKTQLASTDLEQSIKTQAESLKADEDEEKEQLRKELAEVKAQMELKINQTDAVKNMKKMLQDKNAIIAELREKLEKHEN